MGPPKRDGRPATPYVTSALVADGSAQERVAVESWADVQAVIDRLGRQASGYLLLFGERQRQPAVMMIEFDAADRQGPWSCHVHRPQWAHVLLDPKAKSLLVDGVRLPEGLVQRAARTFFQTGKRKRSLVWAIAERPLADLPETVSRTLDDG